MAYYYSAPTYPAFAAPPPPTYGQHGPELYTQQSSQGNYYGQPPLQAYAPPPPPRYGSPPTSNGYQAQDLPQAFQSLNLAPVSHAGNGPSQQYAPPQPSPQPSSQLPYQIPPQPSPQAPYHADFVPPNRKPLPTTVPQQSQNALAGAGKLTYVVRRTGEEKGSRKNYHRDSDFYDIVPANNSCARARHQVITTSCSKKCPWFDLILYRVEHGKQHQAGACSWLEKDPSEIHLKFPFMDWPEPWNPVTQQWASDTGTLKGSMLLWQHDWQDPKVHASQAKRTILRCATTGEDWDGSVTGEKDIEVCRIYLHDDEVDDICATIEMPVSLYPESRQEQLEEMLTIAIANGVASMAGWTSDARDSATATAAVASSSSNPETAVEATHLVTESLNLAAAIMQAAGGGGGC